MTIWSIACVCVIMDVKNLDWLYVWVSQQAEKSGKPGSKIRKFGGKPEKQVNCEETQEVLWNTLRIPNIGEKV